MLIDNVQIKSIDANKVTENSNKRFVTDTKISEWNNKSDKHDHPYAPSSHTSTAGNSGLGHVRSGGDVTISSDGYIMVNNDSHNHSTSTITGLDDYLKTKIKVFNGSFNSISGTKISIGSTMANTNYHVSVTPTGNTDGSLGEIYVTRSTDSFTVYNTGSYKGTFSALVVAL